MTGDDGFLRLRDLVTLLAISPSGVYRLTTRDGTFPSRYQLGPGVVVWKRAEIIEWMASRTAPAKRGRALPEVGAPTVQQPAQRDGRHRKRRQRGDAPGP